MFGDITMKFEEIKTPKGTEVVSQRHIEAMHVSSRDKMIVLQNISEMLQFTAFDRIRGAWHLRHNKWPGKEVHNSED